MIRLFTTRFVLAIVLLVILNGCGALGFGSEHIDHVAPVSGDHDIVGIWEWDSNETYIYIFNADGNGSRGFPNSVQRFTWEIENDGLNMNIGRTDEQWSWEISDNILTITSRQVRNMQYSYKRR